jgi:hypothetical protein
VGEVALVVKDANNNHTGVLCSARSHRGRLFKRTVSATKNERLNDRFELLARGGRAERRLKTDLLEPGVGNTDKNGPPDGRSFAKRPLKRAAATTKMNV